MLPDNWSKELGRGILVKRMLVLSKLETQSLTARKKQTKFLERKVSRRHCDVDHVLLLKSDQNELN